MTDELTLEDIEGLRYSTCTVISGGTYGSDLNGKSILRAVDFNLDGTYSLSTYTFTGTQCQMGGDQLWVYYQTGTLTLGSTGDSGTQIQMTVTQSKLTTYASSSSNGLTWTGYLNSHCPGGPTFSTSSSDTESVANVQCLSVSSPAFSLPTFPAVGAVLYDLIQLDDSSAKTTISHSSMGNLWELGQSSSYPTSTSLNFTEL